MSWVRFLHPCPFGTAFVATISYCKLIPCLTFCFTVSWFICSRSSFTHIACNPLLFRSLHHIVIVYIDTGTHLKQHIQITAGRIWDYYVSLWAYAGEQNSSPTKRSSQINWCLVYWQGLTYSHIVRFWVGTACSSSSKIFAAQAFLLNVCFQLLFSRSICLIVVSLCPCGLLLPSPPGFTASPTLILTIGSSASWRLWSVSSLERNLTWNVSPRHQKGPAGVFLYPSQGRGDCDKLIGVRLSSWGTCSHRQDWTQAQLNSHVEMSWGSTSLFSSEDFFFHLKAVAELSLFEGLSIGNTEKWKAWMELGGGCTPCLRQTDQLG